MHYGKSCQIYILEQYQARMITMDVENGHLLFVGEEILKFSLYVTSVP